MGVEPLDSPTQQNSPGTGGGSRGQGPSPAAGSEMKPGTAPQAQGAGPLTPATQTASCRAAPHLPTGKGPGPRQAGLSADGGPPPLAHTTGSGSSWAQQLAHDQAGSTAGRPCCSGGALAGRLATRGIIHPIPSPSGRHRDQGRAGLHPSALQPAPLPPSLLPAPPGSQTPTQHGDRPTALSLDGDGMT